jgi:hypothetical protein
VAITDLHRASKRINAALELVNPAFSGIEWRPRAYVLISSTVGRLEDSDYRIELYYTGSGIYADVLDDRGTISAQYRVNNAEQIAKFAETLDAKLFPEHAAVEAILRETSGNTIITSRGEQLTRAIQEIVPSFKPPTWFNVSATHATTVPFNDEQGNEWRIVVMRLGDVYYATLAPNNGNWDIHTTEGTLKAAREMAAKFFPSEVANAAVIAESELPGFHDLYLDEFTHRLGKANPAFSGLKWSSSRLFDIQSSPIMLQDESEAIIYAVLRGRRAGYGFLVERDGAIQDLDSYDLEDDIAVDSLIDRLNAMLFPTAAANDTIMQENIEATAAAKSLLAEFQRELVAVNDAFTTVEFGRWHKLDLGNEPDDDTQGCLSTPIVGDDGLKYIIHITIYPDALWVDIGTAGSSIDDNSGFPINFTSQIRTAAVGINTMLFPGAAADTAVMAESEAEDPAVAGCRLIANRLIDDLSALNQRFSGVTWLHVPGMGLVSSVIYQNENQYEIAIDNRHEEVSISLAVNGVSPEERTRSFNRYNVVDAARWIHAQMFPTAAANDAVMQEMTSCGSFGGGAEMPLGNNFAKKRKKKRMKTLHEKAQDLVDRLLENADICPQYMSSSVTRNRRAAIGKETCTEETEEKSVEKDAEAKAAM